MVRGFYGRGRLFVGEAPAETNRRALSPASDRSMMTMPNQRAQYSGRIRNPKDGPLSGVQLSDGIDATGGSPRSRRHQGVMMGIRKKKIATAVITPAIGRLKKIPSEP